MNEFENADIENWDHLCIVCGKSVDQGGGLAHSKAGVRRIALRCPLCTQTFNKDPKHDLSLRFAHEFSTEFRHPHTERPS